MPLRPLPRERVDRDGDDEEGVQEGRDVRRLHVEMGERHYSVAQRAKDDKPHHDEECAEWRKGAARHERDDHRDATSSSEVQRRVILHRR